MGTNALKFGITRMTENALSKFYCESCMYSCKRKCDLNRHFSTQKHKSQNIPATIEIKEKKYSCLLCDYYTNNLKDYNKHCTTNKHKIKNQKDNTNDMIIKILDENKELRQILLQQQEQIREQQEVHHKEIMELIPRIGNKFNLNVFLNEKCKDAVNWDDFMNNLKIDITNTDNLNITECISKTLCNNLQELGIYKRPIHCTDIKRKKIYIKHKDTWENDIVIIKDKLKQASNKIQRKYMFLLDNWEKRHPNWFENEDETIIFSNLINKLMADIDENKCMNAITKTSNIPKID